MIEHASRGAATENGSDSLAYNDDQDARQDFHTPAFCVIAPHPQPATSFWSDDAAYKPASEGTTCICIELSCILHVVYVDILIVPHGQCNMRQPRAGGGDGRKYPKSWDSVISGPLLLI
jgi:hypothetical protein